MLGSLIVIGSGIQCGTHISAQADRAMREADKLFYVIPGPWAEQWLLSLYPMV